MPPVVTTGECQGRPNNDNRSRGCDPVPTGLAYGPNGSLYVSTLSGEAPGEGGGTLYSTANSISFFFGPPDLGQVVEVRPNAFTSSPS